MTLMRAENRPLCLTPAGVANANVTLGRCVFQRRIKAGWQKQHFSFIKNHNFAAFERQPLRFFRLVF